MENINELSDDEISAIEELRLYETIERTKAEREQAQNKGKENNFEGR